jgi:hypothetical protein
VDLPWRSTSGDGGPGPFDATDGVAADAHAVA